MTNHTVTVQPPGATDFNPEAPSDNPLFTNYYAQNNFIGAGVAGEIVDSQRCSIIRIILLMLDAIMEWLYMETYAVQET